MALVFSNTHREDRLLLAIGDRVVTAGDRERLGRIPVRRRERQRSTNRCLAGVSRTGPQNHITSWLRIQHHRELRCRTRLRHRHRRRRQSEPGGVVVGSGHVQGRSDQTIEAVVALVVDNLHADRRDLVAVDDQVIYAGDREHLRGVEVRGVERQRVANRRLGLIGRHRAERHIVFRYAGQPRVELPRTPGFGHGRSVPGTGLKTGGFIVGNVRRHRLARHIVVAGMAFIVFNLDGEEGLLSAVCICVVAADNRERLGGVPVRRRERQRRTNLRLTRITRKRPDHHVASGLRVQRHGERFGRAGLRDPHLCLRQGESGLLRDGGSRVRDDSRSRQC